ncbi:bifunctional phosphoribosyl-AMP cyclohydrolase/phosphoribosyl-ATP diphosphatase HisIE [Ferrimonas balearica]|uniref:bifunctional phosphoribosyl-AMP cyclohydrolase/phosphoribosyl-ATP diphosphatase HisIE n=1 Tax=Ferrimonas balearica TaxID=44012 RepID=UPI001C55B453|nr:bifunctional phosphoribosyl-AMP cyclohydrolase/phosphoribosyl-ATP diphosphatase HisIE [Ferrimonas balearica]MBW3138801.1 bifunctional phosphoribosyl-AMP cyclohydrolase/phosphoribosyl-ATP diphosphatase HisIE [Ferrimonas balearica]MBY6105864.1 bifunctional phosphoribosyl-AMP cyclohydrolase/phosphoribosyl-ATP diphosphatase HisIE [Ferrimonas balearica]MBY6223538.1 bifunctional phosphoribosyl-AMP cyclohydrolase/phosphoribosyl-ATP diphosphatase HisIE [Ferrimonas balearica]
MTTENTLPTIDWAKMDNLVPAVVQHYLTGRVLMVGYMNEAALAKTLETGQVTFYSRSKQRLWTKGESSGNVLALVTLGTDCDNDAILVQARPKGPTCHLGNDSCFDDSRNQPFLNTLAAIVAERRNATPESSYTASLLNGNPRRVAQKVGEEGVEVALAAATNDRENLIDETADLLYHLTVLLEQQQVPMSEVIDRLSQRHR